MTSEPELDPREVTKAMYGLTDEEYDRVTENRDVANAWARNAGVEIVRRLEVSLAMQGVGTDLDEEQFEAGVSAVQDSLMGFATLLQVDHGIDAAVKFLELLQLVQPDAETPPS